MQSDSERDMRPNGSAYFGTSGFQSDMFIIPLVFARLVSKPFLFLAGGGDGRDTASGAPAESELRDAESCPADSIFSAESANGFTGLSGRSVSWLRCSAVEPLDAGAGLQDAGAG